jgi:hypothetical protein
MSIHVIKIQDIFGRLYAIYARYTLISIYLYNCVTSYPLMWLALLIVDFVCVCARSVL